MQIAGSSGILKIGSARTVPSAARPLAVGSPPVLLEAPQGFLASLALSCLAVPSSQSLLLASVVHGARLGAVPTTANVRATRAALRCTAAPSRSPSMRRRVRPRQWRPSPPTARIQVMFRAQASNPSIERTPKSQLRCLSVAAHVER